MYLVFTTFNLRGLRAEHASNTIGSFDMTPLAHYSSSGLTMRDYIEITATSTTALHPIHQIQLSQRGATRPHTGTNAPGLELVYPHHRHF
ncbi:hypothetical protein J1614_007784 [Plenodomus biglobosus]|nr:hypothetical protein J1614_007784 [Plenodomus biglobosus]